MQNFKKRLMEFARMQYDMGQTRFEEMCGIHPGTISAIKSNGPTASVVTKIASACPELNLNWLFRGDEGGQMLNQNSVTQQEPCESSNGVYIINVNDIKTAMIEAIREARL